MVTVGTFPFGQPVRVVTQQDRTPKKIFVLGVYSSPVYARWLGPEGKEKVKFLPVASEPEIFWQGEDAAQLVGGIPVPDKAGRLEAAEEAYNGSAGRALDEQFLQPLNLTRAEAWLCYLVPHNSMSADQEKTIAEVYAPAAEKYGLAPASIPPLPKALADEDRRQAILAELEQSQAEVLMLLGERPIRSFLSFFDPNWKRLVNLESAADTYGRLWPVTIAGQSIQALPVANPWQVIGLGRSVARWHTLHQTWCEHHAPTLLAG